MPSNVQAITSASKGFGSDDMFSQPALVDAMGASNRTMILNNIVTVGHNDDTTSESEGGEGGAAPVRYREQKKMTAKERNARSGRGQGSSSDSDSSKEPARPNGGYPASKAPAHEVDLLGTDTSQAPAAE